ncbi:MAG: YncE family protein [Calditrichaeota bacterium]|nr:MAG: YncE family protein [Calditrichota bacterium]MBL1205287.1 YncE family protein [Calditrichota bacterium]NOG45116.1 beta-propeller fold lactonase family protein [Calditrichota bacterium]
MKSIIAKSAIFSFLLIFVYSCSETTSSNDGSVESIYVCNQGEGTISIIDAQKHEIIETLNLVDYGFSAGSKPHHIVVEEDGNIWYVSLIADGKVLKFNKENELLGTADTPTPGMLVLHPNMPKLYAGRSMTAPNPPSSIISINTETMTVTEIPLPFARPHALMIQNNGEFLYSGSLVENKIAVINAGNDELEETSTFAGDNNVLVQFEVSSDDQQLFATGQISNQLLFFNLDSIGLLSFDQAIDVGNAPWHPVLANDGETLYLGNKMSNSVSAVNIVTKNVVNITGNGLASPHGSALSKDGKYLFISNQNTNGDYIPNDSSGNASDTGTVVVINTSGNTIEKVIEVGKTPSGIGS